MALDIFMKSANAKFEPFELYVNTIFTEKKFVCYCFKNTITSLHWNVVIFSIFYVLTGTLGRSLKGIKFCLSSF